MQPPRPPELDAELRKLAEAEAAARSALDHAMVCSTPPDELGRLWRAWIAANDALGDAVASANP